MLAKLRGLWRRASARLDPIDKFFAQLRLMAFAGAMLWWLMNLHSEERVGQLALLLIIFVLYSLLLYTSVLFSRYQIKYFYMLALIFDLVFILNLVRLTGGYHSTFVLAFYLLAGLHSFYFGVKVGLAVAAASMVFYIRVDPPTFAAEFWSRHLFQLSFLGLVSLCFGILAERGRREREQMRRLLIDLKNAHDLVEKAEKVSSLGRLAAGIAHEINTPASIILNRVECVMEETDSNIPERLKQDLEVIYRQIRRLVSITRKLLSFSRSDLEFSLLDLNSALEEVASYVAPEIEARGIRFKLGLAPNLPRVYGNRARLEEVFMNILSNAMDATPGGGEITVSTSANHSEVRISIADTGIGIPDEDLDKIFDPFFTTKEVGKGTGLGLYIAYQIIKEHNGSISVDSAVGRGTCFSISLPALELQFPSH